MEGKKVERFKYWKVSLKLAELREAGIYDIDITDLRCYLGMRIPWRVLHAMGIYRQGRYVPIQSEEKAQFANMLIEMGELGENLKRMGFYIEGNELKHPEEDQ